MRILRGIFMLMVFCGLSACGAASTTAESVVPTASKSAVAPPAATQDARLGAEYKEGMAYSEFRRITLANGWKAAGDSECLLVTVGDNYKDECKADPEQHGCKVCNSFPELSSCSYDGTCYVSFSKAGSTLNATIYGEITDTENMSGGNPPTVIKWVLSNK